MTLGFILWIVGVSIIAILIFHFGSALFFGLPEPKTQFFLCLRHRFKLLRGIKVKSVNWDCPDGYLYQKVDYSDGSSLFFR